MLSIICGARVAAQPPPLGSETRESVVSDIRRTRLITPQIVRRERRGGPKIRRTRLMTDLPLQARGGMILAQGVRALSPHHCHESHASSPAMRRRRIASAPHPRSKWCAARTTLWPGRSSIGNRRCISCVLGRHPPANETEDRYCRRYLGTVQLKRRHEWTLGRAQLPRGRPITRALLACTAVASRCHSSRPQRQVDDDGKSVAQCTRHVLLSAAFMLLKAG